MPEYEHGEVETVNNLLIGYQFQSGMGLVMHHPGFTILYEE
jgi:hypothetical protein